MPHHATTAEGESRGDCPLDDGFRLDALLARIVAQLPPGELPEELQDTDEGQAGGGR